MPRQTQIEIANTSDVWPHELRCARALASQGYSVEFLSRIEGDRVKSPDLVMDSIVWELKSPETSNLKSLQRILRRAGRQSPNVIVDCARATKLSDDKIEREIRNILPKVKSIKRLIMVRKTGEVIDIRR